LWASARAAEATGVEEAKKQRRSLTNYLETTLMEVWSSQEKEPRKKKPDQKHAPE
jgi:hypothetical protein